MSETMPAVRERRFIDKAGWGPGPWQDEPDKVQWVDEASGLDCLAVRHPTSGHWCGYVGVAEGHPLFGVGYDSCRFGHEDCRAYSEAHSPDALVIVHGGLTFSDFCQEGEEETGICHVPEPGRPERVFWFGFDCAHAGDMSPGHQHNWARTVLGDEPGGPRESYRTLAYVQAECAALATQLARLAAMPQSDAAARSSS